MKTSDIVVVAAMLFLCASLTGRLGFHYPHLIENEPLHHPQKVLRLEGDNLVLQSGSMIALDPEFASGIGKKLSQSDFEIDFEGSRGEPVQIVARQNGWVCGTPWAQPIRIPLFRDTVYKNRRQMIGFGTFIESNGEQAPNAR